MPPERKLRRRRGLKETSRKEERTLVVAIDIGTTFSAASFAVFTPGSKKSTQFYEVLRWPKQEIGDAKIPSVVFYDEDGAPQAVGAATEDENLRIQAQENEWTSAQWWKLKLGPKHLSRGKLPAHIPALPDSVSVEEIYADFLAYIKSNLRAYFTETRPNGSETWDALFPSMTVVLSTPNGWEGAQQQIMREATITAELVDSAGGSRVQFVTEAEAAIHYVSKENADEEWLSIGQQLILCDAGGGTVDITGYKVVGLKPRLQLAESVAPQCLFAGAVFINSAAETYFREHLRDTEWDDDEKIRRIVDRFDRTDKKKFGPDDEYIYVVLSRESKTTIPRLGITRGRLKVCRVTMASFFEHSVTKTIEGITSIYETGGRAAKNIILVGGLAESSYFYSKIQDWSKRRRLSLTRPKGSLGKAVPHGAIHWHLDCIVQSRIIKLQFGTNVQVRFDASNPVHQRFRQYKFSDVDGANYLEDVWQPIAKKDLKTTPQREFEVEFLVVVREDETQLEREEVIYVYRDGATAPTFIREPGRFKEDPNFEPICKVRANLQDCFDNTPAKRIQRTGNFVKTLKFNICLRMGGTELSARIKWRQNGRIVHGPATIAYF
uniref:Hsp70 family chaperone n=1 Tax=Mycena chlorophos TaxID=658473 RepID=A0ABQ0LLG0_MYCCL|nr:predicted protein [Mycena chlorophos]